MVRFSRCLLPRRQDVTDVTYARLSCLVYIITMHGSFHSRFSRIFLRPCGADSNSTPIILKWASIFQLQYASHQSGAQFQIFTPAHSFSNGHRFSTVVCLSPEWHTVPKCLTPGSQLKSKHLERNCHHIPTQPPKVLAKSVYCVLSTYPLHHVPLVARFVTSVMISNNWAKCTSMAPTI